MKPEFSKPFNAEHARAGAPFCCTNGWRAEVLKYASNGLFGTITKPSGEEYPASWTIAGESDSGVISKDRDLAMLPLGRIEGKPVFVGDRLLDGKGVEFTVTAGQVFGPGCLCKWAPTAKVYPETAMTDAEIHRATPKLGMRPSNDAMALSEIIGSLRALANAALRHAVDAGQIVDAEESAEAIRKAYADGQAIAYKHEAGARAARDLAVAKEVRDFCATYVDHRYPVASLATVDLATIISTIK